MWRMHEWNKLKIKLCIYSPLYVYCIRIPHNMTHFRERTNSQKPFYQTLFYHTKLQSEEICYSKICVPVCCGRWISHLNGFAPVKNRNIEPNDHMTESRAWNAVLRAEICWKCFRNNSTTDCNSFRLKRFPDLRVKNFNQEQAEGGGNLSIKRLESRSVSCLSHNELRNGGEWVWRFRGL